MENSLLPSTTRIERNFVDIDVDAAHCTTNFIADSSVVMAEQPWFAVLVAAKNTHTRRETPVLCKTRHPRALVDMWCSSVNVNTTKVMMMENNNNLSLSLSLLPLLSSSSSTPFVATYNSSEGCNEKNNNTNNNNEDFAFGIDFYRCFPASNNEMATLASYSVCQVVGPFKQECDVDKYISLWQQQRCPIVHDAGDEACSILKLPQPLPLPLPSQLQHQHQHCGCESGFNAERPDDDSCFNREIRTRSWHAVLVKAARGEALARQFSYTTYADFAALFHIL